MKSANIDERPVRPGEIFAVFPMELFVVIKRLGLQALSPPVRLVFVITVTSGLLLLEDLYKVLLVTFFALAVFALSPTPPWRSMVAIVIPTVFLYFIGNLLFSPTEHGGFTFFIFRVNGQGAEIALARGLRIGSILLISLAWLSCTPLPELYKSLAPLPVLEPWALSIVRGLQLTKREFVLIGQSLRIRGMRVQTAIKVIISRNWGQLRGNIATILALLRVVIPHQLARTAKATLAWERGKGTIHRM